MGSSLLSVSFSDVFVFVLGKNCNFQSFSFLRFRDLYGDPFHGGFPMMFAGSLSGLLGLVDETNV